MSRIFLVLSTLAALPGCTALQTPSFYLAGSFFPAWLLCAVLGIIGATLIRVLFIRISLDDVLPLRLLFYTCIAFIIAMAIGYQIY